MKFDHIKHHDFRGHRYEIIWRKPRNDSKHIEKSRSKKKEILWGLTEPPTCPDVPRMWLAARLDPLDLLETIMHEALHASFFDLHEDDVEAFSACTTKLLKRMGIKVSFAKT